MKHSFRWFGKKDKIKLKEILQVGVNNIVTALHDIPIGEVWDEKSIIKHNIFQDFLKTSRSSNIAQDGVIPNRPSSL